MRTRILIGFAVLGWVWAAVASVAFWIEYSKPEAQMALPPSPPPASSNLPSTILNLTNWRLTTPVGDREDPREATQIDQPMLTYFRDPRFFHITAGKGVAFRANVGGATTDGSNFPRSELREMTDNGTEEAKWSSKSGTHVMTIVQAITATPKVHPNVVAGQIHDGEDDVAVLRLEGKRLFVDADGDDVGELDPNYRLGTKFKLQIRATPAGIVFIYNNTKSVRYAKTGSSYYFKAGCYTQSGLGSDDSDSDSDSSDAKQLDSPNAFGEVVIYKLQVSHT